MVHNYRQGPGTASGMEWGAEWTVECCGGWGERGHMRGLVFQSESKAGGQAPPITPPNRSVAHANRANPPFLYKGTIGRAPWWVITQAVWRALKRAEWGS